MYHAPAWTAADAALTFALALATFLLLPAFAGAELSGFVIAELIGFAVVPIAVVRARGLPVSVLGLTRPSNRALLGAALFGLTFWFVAVWLTALWSQHVVGHDRAAEESIEGMVSEAPLLAIVLLSLVPAFCEELTSRGLLAIGLARRLGPVVAVLISATAFAALHASVVRALPTGLLGLALAAVSIRTGSVLPAMLAHLLHNGMTLLVATDRVAPLVDAIEAYPGVTLLVCAATTTAGLVISLGRIRSVGS